MSISSLLIPNFSPEALLGGQRLHRMRQIESVYATDDQFQALITEKGVRQTVLFDVSDEDVGLHCSCPTFRTTDLCRHLWGAVLLAQEEKALGDLRKKNSEVISLSDEEADAIFEEIHRRTEVVEKKVEPTDSEDPVEDEAEIDLSEWTSFPPLSRPKPKFLGRPRGGKDAEENPDAWKAHLRELGRSTRVLGEGQDYRRKDRYAFYILNGRPPELGISMRKPFFDSVHLDVGFRDRKKNGELGALRLHTINRDDIRDFRTEEDREILSWLFQVCSTGFSSYSSQESSAMTNFLIPARLVPTMLEIIAPSGRLRVHSGHPEQNRPLAWNPEEIWSPELRISLPETTAGESESQSASAEVAECNLEVLLCFRNGESILRATDANYLSTGLLLIEDRVVPTGNSRIDRVVDFFYRYGPLSVPVDSLREVMSNLQEFGPILPIRTDGELPVDLQNPTPIPTISFSKKSEAPNDQFIRGEVGFLYDDVAISTSDRRSGIWNPATATFMQRDSGSEREHLELLRELGFHPGTGYKVGMDVWDIPKKKFVRATSELIERDWIVEAEGRSYRTGREVDLQVTSGQDWFDIEGSASFDETSLPLPELLAAIREGDRFVLLDDGTYGLIPEEWAKRYGPLAEQLGRRKGGLRFESHQMILLDLMLAELPEVSFDEGFVARREKLQSFAGVTPQKPRRTFQGELRPYQQLALGWFSFLRDFGFGGCLADDMGLGKTVQVLALLEQRRGQKKAKPSLAVVPKSLIFNWMREAERFTPKLRLLDYTGVLRHEHAGEIEEFDLILTTYGTLRRDVAELREIPFDYVILDESQAIKNPRSATAKAVRLLDGEHRLAMSGTPVENRVEELWSLFEFLNPGMLGSARAFRGLLEPPNVEGSNGKTGEQSESALEKGQKIGRILRPFILRRTKAEVATDLPERIEQTIYCDLGGTQRRLYDELRDYLRADVMNQVGDRGIRQSSFKILEALLRLRQAASHPGLIDPKRKSKGCAKFDLLLPRLSELTTEGHKVLVFSQFTSLLEILQGELKKEGIVYEYLDGQTRDRQACVDRFQTDPSIPVFLISLKAGGVGLNLTAASYVYLLDPWWNPAVEAQAIDRTHRIGQQSSVVASRLIARDTIEEKVLALQEEKRALADSIITGENSLISNLSREDLEMLLG